VDGGGAVIAYTRSGGRHAADRPGDHVVLQIDGERYELEVLTGRVTVGRFAGSLAADAATSLARLVDAGLQSVEGEARPGAAAVEITVDGEIGRFGQGSAPGAWAPLEQELERMAGALDDATAAIGLVVAADGSAASLEHRGTDECDVDATALVVRTVLWRGYYEPAGEWTATLTGRAERVGPGWRLSLPFDHGLEIAEDTTLQVEVTFGLGEALAEAVHAPVIAPPT
jgi:hypothetical protein